MKKFATIFTAFAVAAAAVLASAPSYAAVVEPVDITIVGGSNPVDLVGFQPPDGWTPTTAPYPATAPEGYELAPAAHSELYRAEVAPDGQEILLYCVQIAVMRGDDYHSVDQGDADIDTAGYVARIVNDYYPATALPDEFPSGALGNQQRTIAVQGAIWYFTDGFVLAADDDFHDVVADIVDATLEAGPMSDSAADPDLRFSLTGPEGPFEAGTLAGPFVADAALRIERYTINAGGATLYGDTEGTVEIDADEAIAPDQKIWVRSDAAGTITLTANATIAAASGTFYIGEEEGTQSLVAAAQRYDLSSSADAEFVVTPTTTPTPTPTVTPTPTMTPVPAPTPTAALAATGSDHTGRLAVFGALLLLAGAALILGGRSRALRKANTN